MPGYCLGYLPLLGDAFVLTGSVMGVYSFMKAVRFEEAKEIYQRRRSEIQDGPRPLAQPMHSSCERKQTAKRVVGSCDDWHC